MNTSSNRASLRAALFLIGVVIGSGTSAQQAPPTLKKPAAATKSKFDKIGPQVGDQLPNLNMSSMKGEVQRLSDAWRGGPALLVTSSLTCPKSRSRWPELKAIVEKHGEQVNVVIVYVIEAHPVGSICPYKGVEDITPENEREGILRKQPTSLEERIELAEEFKRYLRIGVPIYVDNVKDEAWKALGAAPNLALLVDEQGMVVARAGWFEGKTIEKAIDAHLLAAQQARANGLRRDMSDKDREANFKLLEKAGVEEYAFRYAFDPEDKQAKKLARLLEQTPELVKFVFPAQQGHRHETTTLMEAVLERNPAAVELLLAHGADVKARTSSFDSALQIAARNGDAKIAKLLLQHGADPAFPPTGESPLHEAALKGHREIAKILLDAGMKADLFSDIALGNAAAVRKRLGEDPSWALRPDGAGRMPLDYAAANGQHELATLLLAGGAPVVRDLRTSLDPPLHRAIGRRDAAMIRLLLEAGSSPDTSVGHGGDSPHWTPALHLAIGTRDIQIVKLLLSGEPNLNARNTHSLTPLHVAAKSGQSELVALLLEAGADANVQQGSFSLPCGSGEEETPALNTPLHFAAARGNPATIKALLKGGAQIEARNVLGATPLLATVAPPLYTGINVESRLKNVAALLALGADVNARDNEGRTLLDYAVDARGGGRGEKDLPDLIALLEKHGAQRSMPPKK